MPPDMATHAPIRCPPASYTGMAPKVTAANTRSGNQVARWVLRTWRTRSRVLDSSRCGSSAGWADSLVMANRLAIQTDLRYRELDQEPPLVRVPGTPSGRVCRLPGAASRHASVGDGLHVPGVGATAAAEDGDPRVPGPQPHVVAGQLRRVPGVQVRRLIEFGMALPRRVRADASDAGSGRPAGEGGLEVGGVGAVDAVVG